MNKTTIELNKKIRKEIEQILKDYKNPTEPWHSDVYVIVARLEILFNEKFVDWLENTTRHPNNVRRMSNLIKKLKSR